MGNYPSKGTDLKFSAEKIGGLMVFELGGPGDRDRVTVADHNLQGHFVFDHKVPGIFHHAIIEEDLCEKDENAYLDFLKSSKKKV